MYHIATKSRGFTIVELLIVIVVIGILAAIAILAYTGIQQKAVAASLTTDLENSAKQLKIYQATNSAYPTTIDCSASPVANSICLKTSTGTTYSTFTQANTDPQTFCLTATNGSTNYFVNQDGIPASGACAVTNLATNPSVETNVTGWASNWGTSATGTATRVTSGGYSGNSYFRMAWTATASVNWGGLVGPTLSVVPGNTFTVSVWARSSKAQPLWAFVRFNTFPTNGDVDGNSINAPANTWVRLDVTATVPAGVSTIQIRAERNGSGSWVNGDTLDTDAMLITQGPTLYNYADGSFTSQGWSWTGAANASTSTGPPL